MFWFVPESGSIRLNVFSRLIRQINSVTKGSFLKTILDVPHARFLLKKKKTEKKILEKEKEKNLKGLKESIKMFDP